uniref:Putative pdz domain-containing protein n=1 Tax=Culex tarsalis TaxID=7177 RepID=A0A1Q3FH03_CULTA
MALEEPKLADEQEQGTPGNDVKTNGTGTNDKRDDAPDYYKRPKFKRNIIPFDTEDLSVRVIRERFLIPDQVKEGSAAAKAGLNLGDQIVKINGADASAMRLATAESVIKQAGDQLQLVVTKDEEETKDPHAPAAADAEPKPKETREITFAGNDPNDGSDVTNNPHAPKHKPSDDAEREHWIQPPERKVWHPIVWQQPPPPIPPDVYGKDAPHQRLIKNIRRLLVETKAKPEERQKHIEHMMLSLPSGPRPKSDEDEEEEPKPVPKPKKKKKSKKNGKGRKRTESETSDDSISHKISVSATRSKTIIEEA